MVKCFYDWKTGERDAASCPGILLEVSFALNELIEVACVRSSGTSCIGSL